MPSSTTAAASPVEAALASARSAVDAALGNASSAVDAALVYTSEPSPPPVVQQPPPPVVQQPPPQPAPPVVQQPQGPPPSFQSAMMPPMVVSPNVPTRYCYPVSLEVQLSILRARAARGLQRIGEEGSLKGALEAFCAVQELCELTPSLDIGLVRTVNICFGRVQRLWANVLRRQPGGAPPVWMFEKLPQCWYHIYQAVYRGDICNAVRLDAFERITNAIESTIHGTATLEFWHDLAATLHPPEYESEEEYEGEEESEEEEEGMV